jgi:hypothetical protein
MAPTYPGWSLDEEGRKTWPASRYSVESPRATNWLAKAVVKQHRTIGTTLNTLVGAGFTIRHVREWAPTPDQIAANPDLAEELERPMILIVSVQRHTARARRTLRPAWPALWPSAQEDDTALR